ncbi:MAG: hypothetical protein ABSC60_13340, partial [Acidobacteriota bacterium]
TRRRLQGKPALWIVVSSARLCQSKHRQAEESKNDDAVPHEDEPPIQVYARLWKELSADRPIQKHHRARAGLQPVQSAASPVPPWRRVTSHLYHLPM